MFPKQIEADTYGAAYDAGALWAFETARYTVALFAVPEEMSPEDGLEFPEDIEFARSGDPAHWFCAILAVYDEHGKLLAHDALGACSYRSFCEFYTSHRDRNPDNRNTLALKARNSAICHYFPDMVREAIAAARAAQAKSAI